MCTLSDQESMWLFLLVQLSQLGSRLSIFILFPQFVGDVGGNFNSLKYFILFPDILIDILLLQLTKIMIYSTLFIQPYPLLLHELHIKITTNFLCQYIHVYPISIYILLIIIQIYSSRHHLTSCGGRPLQPLSLRHQRVVQRTQPGGQLYLYPRLHRQPLHRMQARVCCEPRVPTALGLCQPTLCGSMSGRVWGPRDLHCAESFPCVPLWSGIWRRCLCGLS